MAQLIPPIMVKSRILLTLEAPAEALPGEPV
jgi:hypothetical protein